MASMPLIETRKKGSVTVGSVNNTMDSSALIDPSDEKMNIRNEFAHAKKLLDATHKLPISIDNKCLMSM